MFLKKLYPSSQRCIPEIQPNILLTSGAPQYSTQNSGATALVATDNAVITDTFNPIISGVTATLNGVAIGFSYDEATGQFRTNEGEITVPAATVTQDLTTGEWTVTPGNSTLIVTGTI